MTPKPETIVMVLTSYPRFPGDTYGTFMEPIAHSLAARGHEVHLVLPWHPQLQRPAVEAGVHFHPFRYAPLGRLHVFGYAAALREDVRLRLAAWATAPLALLSGWRMAERVIERTKASVVHGHWVVPGGVIAAAASRGLPLVVSLHGSDVYVAERYRAAGASARAVFRRAGWVTACSDDLRQRAIRLGASPDRIETVPYGVDGERFRPNPQARDAWRVRLGLAPDQLLVCTAGRFVRKKGFEYLIDAMASLASEWPSLMLVIGGSGDLDAELRARVRDHGLTDRVRFVGLLPQDAVADLVAAADVVVVPSVHDAAGNVDGLPNMVLEALASGTPLVATTAGGIPSVVQHGETGLLVPEREPAAIAAAVGELLRQPERRARMGRLAREHVLAHQSWASVARRFEAAYEEARSTAACGACQQRRFPSSSGMP